MSVGLVGWRGFRRVRTPWQLAMILSLIASLTGSPAYAQAPVLILTPATGPPPTVNGTLSGSGWCHPAASVEISGPGVSGSATIGSDGTLTGTFSVTGAAGALATITVNATCRAGGSLGRANFRFGAAPTRTASVPPAPSRTPTPSAALPPVTWTPEVGLASSETGSITIYGCEPTAGDVSILFSPFSNRQTGPFPGLIPPTGPSVSPYRSRVVGTGDPHVFIFSLPPQAPDGTWFEIDPELNSPNCPENSDPPGQAWLAGQVVDVKFVLPGTTELLESNLGATTPDTAGEIHAGEWVTFYNPPKSPKGYTQLFRWMTDLPAVDGGVLQASVHPFPSAEDAALSDPPGLVASWDVTCVNCQFSVDLSILSPTQSQSSGSPSETLVQVINNVLTFLGNVAESLIQWVGNLLQGGAGPRARAPGVTPLAGPAGSGPQGYLGAGDGALLLISEFYFRVVPMSGEHLAGQASNSVRIAFNSPGFVTPGIPNCVSDPDAVGCIQPSTAARPFVAEIISYHGIIPPKNDHYNCYKSTEAATVMVGLNQFTYPAGTSFCPPEPKEKSWIEAVIDFAVDSLNWVSAAYDSLKAKVVDVVADFVPSSLCDKACLTLALEAGLAACGMPPNIPNLNELMDQGIDYLAEQAVEQIGIPPEVSQLGSLAVEQWKAQAQAEFKQGIQEGIHAAEIALGNSVGYVPDGVPVAPDPEGDYQPATLVLRITRVPTVPASADTCSMSSNSMSANLLIMSLVQQPSMTPEMQTFNNENNGPAPDLHVGEGYYLYELKGVPLPTLGLGESITIPVVLRPAFTWGTGYGLVSAQASAWSALYFGGQASISVTNPCTQGAGLNVPADNQP